MPEAFSSYALIPINEETDLHANSVIPSLLKVDDYDRKKLDQGNFHLN